ncbi:MULTISPECIES: N-acetylneuraminate synthase family protein [unclassified Neptuniibacter]|uniref:N-acetylneuraminate synthase family protein n=1 Tax=unclassified Neptuniibacter TaxID=2630693 RepID=UPI000C5A17BC|nr:MULTISPECIES: N-acetylneuraminate synthase family protein [unclassified Neptuniibacter]MAY40956.1 spore coat protein [Oceanospirillaceae bacterium]|tara:strand:+ start:22222 stop:23748 length:1527 start_codon:yes stop_codon:yes gene_type:complete
MKSLPLSKPLIVLELANNHMGDISHGLKMIEALAEVCKKFPFNFAIKLQYRQMGSFIHPSFQDRMDLKYVKRFMETRLTQAQFEEIISKIKDSGFLAMCTPFDSESVPLIAEQGFDIIKVASCSFTDWPLLETIADTNMPIIASAAAATVDELDSVVTFLSNRGKEFALNHCVAEYPTPPEKIQLNQIDFLKQRYPNIPIGYSTHEPPSFTGSISMAVAKGATLFERHVALPSEKYQPNEYSATPEQLKEWLRAIETAFKLCGTSETVRVTPPIEEIDSLRSLRRGAYLKHNVEAGQQITDDDIYFAIPCQEGQVTANEWSKYIHRSTTHSIEANSPLLAINSKEKNTRLHIIDIVKEVNNILTKGKIVIPSEASLEISHHYGESSFSEIGAAMITIMNRQYCKKLIILLAGQRHPEHLHKKKDETFYVLHGSVEVNLEGTWHQLNEGEMITVSAHTKHSFRSLTGGVFEEVSTRHFSDDSYYTDNSIMQNRNRKTYLRFWQNLEFND